MRTILRAPGFATLAILTIALGVGAGTAVFSVVHQVLIRPLPYADPERLIKLADVPVARPTMTRRSNVSSDRLREYEATPSLGGVAGYARVSRTLTGSGRPAQVLGEAVTPTLFAVLGVSAHIGRVFDGSSGDHVVLLTHAFWQSSFSADPLVVGRSIRLDDEAYEVVGVLRPEFKPLSEYRSGYSVSFLIPTTSARQNVSAVAKLRPGVSIDQARVELRALRNSERGSAGTRASTMMPEVASLRPLLIGDLQMPLMLMMGAAGLVLLVACVNLANLLIVRAVGQQREVAVKLAIGATRGRLATDLAARGLLLGIAGGAVGVIGALWLGGAIVAIAPVTMPPMGGSALDPVVVMAAFVIAVLTGVIASLVPALRFRQVDVSAALRSAAASVSGSRTMSHWRGAMLAGQVAAALVLAVGGGLLVQSVWRLSSVDLGFEPKGVLLFGVDPPANRYPDPDARVAFFEELERRLSRIPGVSASAVANEFPLRGGGLNRVRLMDDHADSAGDRQAAFQAVSAGYFHTLRIPLVQGRLFTAQDRAGAPAAAIVSETFVRRFLAGLDPIGRRFRGLRSDPQAPVLTIVGVVRDARRDGPIADHAPQVYLAATQPETYVGETDLYEVAIRAEGFDPRRLHTAVEQAVWSIDPAQPIRSVVMLDEVIAGAFADRTFNMRLLSSAALLALGLAVIGVYGVVGHAAAQRTREVGIRIALGAQRTHVLSLVVANGLQWATVGVILGVAGASACTRFLSAMLFGLTPTDLPTFAGLALGMLAVVALASYVPARKAAGTDPLSAIRNS